MSIDNIEDVLNEENDVPETDVAEETPEAESEETPEQPETVVPEQETPEDFSAIDPTKLPPEVQKYYKGMQSAFTRKMQALQGAFEGLNSHKSRLELMDRAIAGDPEARARLAELAGQRTQEPKPSEADDVPEEFATFKEMREYLRKDFTGQFEKMMQAVIEKQIAPIHEHYRKQQIESEISAMRSKYEDFDEVIPQIIKIRDENPGLSLENSYKLATHQRPVPPTQRTFKPGKSPTAVTQKQGKQPKTFKEAAELALRELNGK